MTGITTRTTMLSAWAGFNTSHCVARMLFGWVHGVPASVAAPAGGGP